MPEITWIGPAHQPGKLRFPARSMVMVAGVPGAGKSALLRGADLRGTRLLEADVYRGAVQERRGLDRDAFVADCVADARTLFFADLNAALAAGQDVVVDAALVRSRARAELCALAQETGHSAHVVFVDATWEQCLTGVRSRARTVEREQLAAYWRTWSALRGRMAEGGWPEPELASVTVIDRAACPSVRALRFDGPAVSPGRGAAGCGTSRSTRRADR